MPASVSSSAICTRVRVVVLVRYDAGDLVVGQRPQRLGRTGDRLP